MKHKRERETMKNLYLSRGTIKADVNNIVERFFFSSLARDTLHITSQSVNLWVNRSEQKHLVLITAPRKKCMVETLIFIAYFKYFDAYRSFFQFLNS